MPLARYFFCVGGALLALLFIVDLFQPSLPDAARTDAGTDMPAIRIHSDRKWPERVVFDTSLPTITPVPLVKAEASVPAPALPTAADVSAKARVREAFAQFVAPEPKKPEPKPQRKRRVVKTRPGPPTTLVAQQPRFGFGFFDNGAW